MSKPKQRTILVVEDVDEIGRTIQDALKKRGYHVMRAANAEDAIELAEQDAPTMVLTDLDLPTFDSLLNRLREHQTLHNLVVAIMDINGPTLSDQSVNVLADFEALDDLVSAID